MNVQVFPAGDGQHYGLVSLPWNHDVVVYKRVGSRWEAHLEFNHRGTTGSVWPARDATANIAAAFDEAMEREAHCC
jgi:hypothetical protein